MIGCLFILIIGVYLFPFILSPTEHSSHCRRHITYPDHCPQKKLSRNAVQALRDNMSNLFFTIPLGELKSLEQGCGAYLRACTSYLPCSTSSM